MAINTTYLILVLSIITIILVGCDVQENIIYDESNNEHKTDIQEPFPPKESEQIETLQEIKPVLKNLGVNIKPWNKETDLAGDIIFTEKIFFKDDFIKNEKPFLEFGTREHTLNNPNQNIEYWYFLKPGTKIRAATDGVARISYLEHSKDWAVNIQLQGTPWSVGHEHIINLEVEDGDFVNAGDILGEAIPSSLNSEMAFTELSVWEGGANIIKYCPFDFLDPSLKAIYEEKLNRLADDWEEFTGKDYYERENWVAPGCLLHNITER